MNRVETHMAKREDKYTEMLMDREEEEKCLSKDEWIVWWMIWKIKE